MDKFFTQKHCDNCGGPLDNGRTMSQFNTDCICMDCSEKEKESPDYKEALDAEHDEIKKGNYNFKGLSAERNMTEKIKVQILIIRQEGKYNLFDTIGVQHEAHNKDFHELVIFIEDHKKEYVDFILWGETK